MNKFLLATLTIGQPIIAAACFDGTLYAVNSADGALFLLFSFLALVLSVTLRVIRGAFRLYLPLIAIVLAVPWPFVEWINWGGGDCGYGFLQATQVSATVVSMLLLYEIVVCYQWARSQRQGHDA